MVQDAFKAKDAEVAPEGGEVGVGELFDGQERHIFDYTGSNSGVFLGVLRGESGQIGDVFRTFSDQILVAGRVGE